MRRAWRELMMMAGIDRRAIVTFLLLCLVIGIDKADQLLLPAVYLEICREFSIGPAFLGLITFWRGVLQAVVAVLAGPLGGRFDRVRLISFGVLLWAVASALVGAATSIEALWVARAVTGAGLGLTIPLIFALVADLAPDGKRGRAFGLLLFAANGGGAVGAYAATSMAAAAGAGEGVAGWRLAFYSIAVVSLIAAALVLCLAHEPRRSSSAADSPAATSSSSAEPAAAAAATVQAPFTFRGAVHDAWSVLRVRSFALILAQGAVGSAPWYSMSFLTMYLQTPQHSIAAQQQHLPPPHSHPFPPSCCTPHNRHTVRARHERGISANLLCLLPGD